MRLAIGCDHIGLELKNHLIEYLTAKGHTVEDVGTYTAERTDYPIYGYRVAKKVIGGEADMGILVCGTGVGISLAANKVDGIRAVVCSEPYSAYMARLHNNANIVSMGARVIGEATAEMIVDAFLNTQYEGGRHQRRIDMMTEIEKGTFEA